LPYYAEGLGVLLNVPIEGFGVFCINEIVAIHVLVSEAHVVAIVFHLSESNTLEVFVNVPANGFGVLLIAILPETYATRL